MIFDSQVINALQASLRLHWSAIEVYSAQASHFARWGYSKLAEAAAKDAAEEREHADRLMARLEFFDVAPDMSHEFFGFVRHDFISILSSNLSMENLAATVERAGILTARESGDGVTADLLSKNLEGSEDSVRSIEAAQKVIAQVGIQNYLANQV